MNFQLIVNGTYDTTGNKFTIDTPSFFRVNNQCYNINADESLSIGDSIQCDQGVLNTLFEKMKLPPPPPRGLETVGNEMVGPEKPVRNTETFGPLSSTPETVGPETVGPETVPLQQATTVPISGDKAQKDWYQRTVQERKEPFEKKIETARGGRGLSKRKTRRIQNRRKI